MDSAAVSSGVIALCSVMEDVTHPCAYRGAEVFQTIPEVTQDLVIHRARGFLTVAGNKRDRIALVDQFNRALHVFDV